MGRKGWEEGVGGRGGEEGVWREGWGGKEGVGEGRGWGRKGLGREGRGGKKRLADKRCMLEGVVVLVFIMCGAAIAIFMHRFTGKWERWEGVGLGREGLGRKGREGRGAVSILGFENCQSFFSATAHVQGTAPARPTPRGRCRSAYSIFYWQNDTAIVISAYNMRATV